QMRLESFDPLRDWFANIILKLISSSDLDQIEIYETKEGGFEIANYQLKPAMECFVAWNQKIKRIGCQNN
ncbi:hypothetical protein HHI36_024347, partial [Cryptolaemus montrouzieri]